MSRNWWIIERDVLYFAVIFIGLPLSEWNTSHISAPRERSPVGVLNPLKPDIIMTDALQSKLGWNYSAPFEIIQQLTSHWLLSGTISESSVINVQELPRGITVVARRDESCFDSASCTSCRYSTLCFQMNCSIHTILSSTQAISVTVHFRLSLLAFTAAQLHLGYFLLIDLSVGLRRHKHYGEK